MIINKIVDILFRKDLEILYLYSYNSFLTLKISKLDIEDTH